MGFWEDRWIPTLSGNKLNDVNGDVNLNVSYVISNGSWYMSKLVGLVSQEELNAILAIPLRSGRLEDRLILHAIWRVCAAPRVNNFIWRDCIEAFTTNEALVKTRCGIPIVCRVSNNGFSPVSGYVVNKGVGNAQVDDSWVAPGTDLLKCNVEGTFHSGFAVGGVGIICRNALGEVLDGCAEKLLTCSSLLIKAWALKKALLLACLKGWERVVFESDCAVLVDAVAGLKGAKTSRPSICRLVSEEGVKRVVMKDCVFNPPPSLASILTFDVTRSGSNIGDRSSNSCFSARCAVGSACFREGVG
ncbi:putative ribonuclease H-like domain-containing protein [Senna tora]|uniref:Putative ribonuclease H-like domain-containing protein n=1 Tax=Senna tora TaxID=362788 RepID=A0A834XCU4_9FABA|nr:putative ribonuclease H-like domain-containing protein [Senna tora]